MSHTDLLTEFEIKKKRNLYSKLSIAAALLAITLICYDFIIMPGTLKPDESPDITPVQMISMGVVLFSILGIIFSIASLIRREKPAYIKVIGVTLNALLFLFWAAAIVFALVMDSR